MRLTLIPTGEVLIDEPDSGNRCSYLIYCPACGTPWARLERAPWWVGRGVYCRIHSTPTQIGGSFFSPYNEVDLAPRNHFNEAAIPLGGFLLARPKLLQWEFQRHLDWPYHRKALSHV